MPTGTVFNSTSDFVVSNGTSSAAAVFLFASQAGIISGWNPTVSPSTEAHVGASPPDAVYTGLAIGHVGTANYLYAVNFEHARIDVFDKTFGIVHLAGSFTDPAIPNSYAPFNIQNLGGDLYVTYAQQSHKEPDEETDKGAGFVDVFDTSGHLESRLLHGSSPLALGGSRSRPAISARSATRCSSATSPTATFRPTTGQFLGELQNEDGKPIVIDGLWGMTFGNGVTAGDRTALYFAAGPDDETHGLFGSVRFVDSSTHAAERASRSHAY
jgi:uncharacterized protein (TIGR03118 family)